MRQVATRARAILYDPDRPVIIDGFCKAGGAGMGYWLAGFQPLGVDIEPQPRYPFPFVQADALEFLASANLARVAAIHVSPVCKRYSQATPVALRDSHPDQIGPVRKLLEATGLPWVIENVPGAPLRPDLLYCGCMLGLPELRRVRLFETSWRAFELIPACHHTMPAVVVTGHGQCRGMKATGLAADWRRAMGIDWMTRDELSQAVPPLYTERVGMLLRAALPEVAF